jgi:endonuclease YncB( thermonuclease family)
MVFAVCPPPPATPEIGVRRIVDGDTLALADGRHLRFIGINAMELGHGKSPDQPYAAAARARVRQLIATGHGKLRLESAPEAYDEYGRTLAYVFVGDEDLGLELIKEGLAVVVAVPPHMGRLGCYADAEARARGEKLNIWSKDLPSVSGGADADLRPGAFPLVEGRVTAVTPSRAGIHMTVDGRLPLWIPAADLSRFDVSPATLMGRQVLVRGWVRLYRGQPELDVHAPAALIPLP